jgi:hypothetical protein
VRLEGPFDLVVSILSSRNQMVPAPRQASRRDESLHERYSRHPWHVVSLVCRSLIRNSYALLPSNVADRADVWPSGERLASFSLASDDVSEQPAAGAGASGTPEGTATVTRTVEVLDPFVDGPACHICGSVVVVRAKWKFRLRCKNDECMGRPCSTSDVVVIFRSGVTCQACAIAPPDLRRPKSATTQGNLSIHVTALSKSPFPAVAWGPFSN